MRITIALSLCLLGLASCEKDIKIDLPAPAPKLVMNAVIRVGDPINMSLCRSAGIRESQQTSRAVPGATVVLFVDGQPKDTLLAGPGGSISMYMGSIVAEPGKTYRLTVNAQGYEPIEATASAPALVPASSWDFKPNAWNSGDGGMYDELGIGIQDPPSPNDYFILRIVEPYNRFGFDEQDFYSWGGCAYTSDPSVESSSSDPLGGDNCIPMNSILVNDALFNGEKKRISMYVYSGALNPQQDTAGNKLFAQYYLYHVSKDFYNYIKTFRAALDANGNPFAEPINVSTNVKNGYGIFAILSEHVEDIEI